MTSPGCGWTLGMLKSGCRGERFGRKSPFGEGLALYKCIHFSQPKAPLEKRSLISGREKFRSAPIYGPLSHLGHVIFDCEACVSAHIIG